MNFRLGRYLFFGISLIIGAFFLLVGLITLLLPWSDTIKNELTRFILENSLIFSLFGLGFLLIGISLILYAWHGAKKRCLYLKTGKNSVVLDENVVQNYLETYFQGKFHNQNIPVSFKIKKKYLLVSANLPKISSEEVAKIKEDLNDIFGRLLGYPHDIHLEIIYQK